MSFRPHNIPRIVDSAYRHGLTTEDILHACRNPIDVFVHDDGIIMLIGSTFSGAMIEVGIRMIHGFPVVVHAMHARKKYIR